MRGASSLPALHLTAAEAEQLDRKWEQKCAWAVRYAKKNCVTKCALPPAHLLASFRAAAVRPAPALPREKLQRLAERERDRFRRLPAQSHQGLFCRAVPSQKVPALGSEPAARYWDSVCDAEEEGKAQLSVSDALRRSQTPQTRFSPIGSQCGDSLGGEGTSNASARSLSRRQRIACLFDLREGLRMVILGIAPSPLGTPKTWPPKGGNRREGSKDESLAVYHAFLDMLAMDRVDILGDPLPENKGASQLDEEQERLSYDPAGDDLLEIAYVSWPGLVAWAEDKEISADHVKTRHVCSLLVKALHYFVKAEASPHQLDFGCSLAVLLRWIWPAANDAAVARMHTHMCLEEFEKLRVEPPRVVSDDERKHIVHMFHEMDRDEKGYLTAMDIAGGKDVAYDLQEQLKNTIEPVLCQYILGDGQIHLDRFLELFCPDGTRGHEHSQRVIQPNGLPIVAVRGQHVDYEGWVVERVSPAERQQRRRVRALENEVARLQQQHMGIHDFLRSASPAG
eukprot:TRINITY_DN25989_c0_g1_i1.p1 TRINITY_DN25989_c0_g1~~TRINITY_DN25989_c0_g1_i1.p1  ORF type:complete len:510 (-),score=118.03 TRINITY_DN25989_c0_g1_i1:278-1807(-)